mmetsp:Transcript_13937/g.22176  ORF Transcript_13937/g.22176 Transcript_13937/m.22176 type:complete len:105 (+) Transcript_13937:109-423(+)
MLFGTCGVTEATKPQNHDLETIESVSGMFHIRIHGSRLTRPLCASELSQSQVSGPGVFSLIEGAKTPIAEARRSKEPPAKAAGPCSVSPIQKNAKIAPHTGSKA